MRKQLMILAVLLGGLIAAALVHSESNAPSVIRFSTALITPYQQLGEQGELEGYAIPLIKCLMEKQEFEYSIEVLPWARAQKNVEIGQSDAFFVASRNSERDAYAQQSAPLFSGERSWYLREGYGLDPRSEEFRMNAMVGTVFGTNMHRMLMQNFRNVVTKTSEEELIELLRLGRVDALLLTELMFEHTVRFVGLDQNNFQRVPAQTEPLGAYFRHSFLKAHPGFLTRFNANIPVCQGLVSMP